MKKVTFLIDGFNLYHSILDLENDKGTKARWLDLKSLCRSFLHLLGKKGEIKINGIYYFSAIPYYLEEDNPRKIRKQKNYIKCLESTGIKVELSRFKKKDVRCKKCHKLFEKYEEKETDVAIAVKLMEVFFKDRCDIGVILTGDTDLVPALKICKKHFKRKKLVVIFPYKRYNRELKKFAYKSFRMGEGSYKNNLFPSPVIIKKGIDIHKPSNW